MNGVAHPRELGAFLKARRSELTPGAVGLADAHAQRRVTGLRREEVARLAAISTDYYTRLEQGRRQASEAVLDSLARVLRLTEDERDYLFDLAGRSTVQQSADATPKVEPQLRRLLGELTTTPAIVLDRRMDVLAWNRSAAALITDFAAVPEEHRNYAWLLFADAAVRALHTEWEQHARLCAAMLRREYGCAPDDRRLARLVAELSALDGEFRRWWGDHRVALLDKGTKKLRHPAVGDLVLDWEALACVSDPEQKLIVWTAEPGTRDHDALRRLATAPEAGESTNGRPEASSAPRSTTATH